MKVNIISRLEPAIQKVKVKITFGLESVAEIIKQMKLKIFSSLKPAAAMAKFKEKAKYEKWEK